MCLCPRDKLLKMAQKMQTYDEMSTLKYHRNPNIMCFVLLTSNAIGSSFIARKKPMNSSCHNQGTLKTAWLENLLAQDDHPGPGIFSYPDSILL